MKPNIRLLLKQSVKVRNALGDKLQQHVAAIDHSVCTGQAGDTYLRQIASCVLENFLWKSLSLQQILSPQ